MNKDNIKNIITSRFNKGKTTYPNIMISYSILKVRIGYRIDNSRMYRGGVIVYYGFGFVYRIICAVIKVKRSLERDLKNEYEKDNWL